MEARTHATTNGAIRFDTTLPSVPDVNWFDPEGWRQRRAIVTTMGAGRGSAWAVEAGNERYVLRHYRRGGAVRRLLGDRYWFRGGEATRGFREFDLLARLSDEGMAVPRPVAARFERHGLWYRADLLMHQIGNARSLDDSMRANDVVDWSAVGRAIGAMHRRGVWHADLNAHNLLIDEVSRVWLIDFDRARVRNPASSWRRANLDRLTRSLRKLGHEAQLVQAWPRLEAGYAEACT